MVSIAQVKEFLKLESGARFSKTDRDEAYEWIGRTLGKFRYFSERTQPTFPRVYTPEDIALIAEVDNAESRRTGGAVKKTLADMYMVYGDQ